MPDFAQTSKLDNTAEQLDLLGSQWAYAYSGQEFLSSILSARAQLEKQTFQDAQEIQDTLSRVLTPILHTRLRHFLNLKESELNNLQVGLLQYGDGAVYGQQPDTGVMYRYGIAQGFGKFAFPAPPGLRIAPVITNRIKQPSLTLVDGVDYYLEPERSAIVFQSNPFNDPLVPIRSIFEGDVVVDREAQLWITSAQFDTQQFYKHWGYVMGILGPSTQNYKDFINAIYDAVLQGTAREHIERSLAAISDVPLAKHTGETVQSIHNDADSRLVITDQEVYRLALAGDVTVAVGDVLSAGDSLSSSLRIDEFNRGELPDGLQALSVGKEFLIGGYYDGLIFENKTVDLVVEENVDGHTRVSFEIGGFPGDIEKFWNDLHARGVAAGSTLANLLDLRPAESRTTEPTASSLPATTNPLVFLTENIFRNNAFLVRLKPTFFGPNALGLQYIKYLRRLTPPHTAMLVLVELTASDETIILDGQDEQLSIDESSALGRSLEAIQESVEVPDLVLSERVVLRQVAGSCI